MGFWCFRRLVSRKSCSVFVCKCTAYFTTARPLPCSWPQHPHISSLLAPAGLQVMAALQANSRRGGDAKDHVPYRESRLTRMLQVSTAGPSLLIVASWMLLTMCVCVCARAFVLCTCVYMHLCVCVCGWVGGWVGGWVDGWV